MADDKNTKKGAAAPNGDGWLEVQLDRPMFKAEAFSERIQGTQSEEYKGAPVQGYVLGYTEMPAITDGETGEMRDWAAYIIQLTAPVKAFKRGEKEAVLVPAGEQILFAATSIIAQTISPEVANHPTHMLPVRITPLRRDPQPNSTKKLWRYKLETQPAKKREASFSGNTVIQSMLASARSAARQLGDGKTVEASGEAVS